MSKYDEAKARVGVEFGAPHGLLSLRHTNIRLVEGGAKDRADRLLKELDKRKS